jgi:hypothetical protein
MAHEQEENTAAPGPRNPGGGMQPPGWHKPLPEKLPEPTAWPAVLAIGACLLAFGVLTSWIISAAGLVIFAIGAGGWIGRMRDEQPH